MAHELKLDEAHLVKQVVAIVMVSMQDKLEKFTCDSEMNSFELTRLKARLFVTIEREVAQAPKKCI